MAAEAFVASFPLPFQTHKNDVPTVAERSPRRASLRQQQRWQSRGERPFLIPREEASAVPNPRGWLETHC